MSDTIRFVALLGSINTGGNRLKMADLRRALSDAGLVNVATIVASGNVLFDGMSGSEEQHSATVVDVLSAKFGIDSFAIVMSSDDLIAALSESPFAEIGADNLVHIHFLESQPSEAAFEQLFADHAERGPERLARGTRALHVDYVEGVGSTKLTGPFIARRLGCRGTARNVRSIHRIIDAMEG